MKTNYVNPHIPPRYSQDPGDFAIIAAAQATPYAKASAARRKARAEARKAAEKNVAKYTPETQPRDVNGRFRKILARLKSNLGEEATSELAKSIEATEAAQIAGNYEEMRSNSQDLIKMIDSVQDGELPQGTTKNLRRGAADLGRILAYLPLPQGTANQKVRFSDLPPASSDLVRDMVKRVEEKLDSSDAEKYTRELKQFMAGSRTMSSDEMAVYLNKLLRVLA